MFKTKILFLLIWLTFSLPSFALSLNDSGTLQLSGYLQHIAQKEMNEQKTTHLNRFRVLGDYTESGLNLNWQPLPQTKLIADINYNSIKKDPFSINILSLKQTLYQDYWGDISIGAGRLKNTLIGFNSAQDPPLLRETTDFARVYMGNMAQSFASIDGGRLQLDWGDERGNFIKSAFFIGQMLKDDYSLNINNQTTLDVKEYQLFGIKLTWEPAKLPGWTLAPPSPKSTAKMKSSLAHQMAQTQT